MIKVTTRQGLLWISPLFIGVVFLYILPMAASVVLSFFRWSLTDAPVFIGIENYRQLTGIGRNIVADPLFVQALENTFFLALIVPFQVAGSFFLALFLQEKSLRYRLLRLIVFLPTLVSPIALYIMWRSILFTDTGFIGQILHCLGFSPPLWLDDPEWSKPAVMLVLLWESIGGFQMLFFLAALRQIPAQLHDLAKIDGLNIFRKIKHVYLPWLKTLILFNLCLSFIAAVQGGFEVSYILTGGGPLRSTTTLSYYLFENAFQWQRMGYGAAVGICMFIFLTPLLLIRFLKQKRVEG